MTTWPPFNTSYSLKLSQTLTCRLPVWRTACFALQYRTRESFEYIKVKSLSSAKCIAHNFEGSTPWIHARPCCDAPLSTRYRGGCPGSLRPNWGLRPRTPRMHCCRAPAANAPPEHRRSRRSPLTGHLRCAPTAQHRRGTNWDSNVRNGTPPTWSGYELDIKRK